MKEEIVPPNFYSWMLTAPSFITCCSCKQPPMAVLGTLRHRDVLGMQSQGDVSW